MRRIQTIQNKQSTVAFVLKKLTLTVVNKESLLRATKCLTVQLSNFVLLKTFDLPKRIPSVGKVSSWFWLIS